MTISDLHEARDEIATLKSRVRELESFVVAEGECHISDDEFQRMTAEIEQLRAGLKCISEGDRPESSQWLADEILAGRFVTTKDSQ